MKKILILPFLLLLSNLLIAQESPPVDNFVNIPTYSFKYHTPTQETWLYKGAAHGWSNLSKWNYYRRLNNHDSLSTLDERSYNSLTELPDLSIYAPIDDPTFTTKITTPALNIPNGATENYFWKCVNATTGAGQWAAVSASQVYKGTWSASTNTPTLADGTGTAGWYYRCTVAGTVNLGSGNITFSVGDDAYYNGTVWQRVPGSSSQWITSGDNIYYNNGGVGIFNTAPSVNFPLWVGSSDKSTSTYIRVQSASTSECGLSLGVGSNQWYMWNVNSPADLRFSNTGGLKMSITTAGNLIVGNTSSETALGGVNGQIIMGTSSGISLASSNSVYWLMYKRASDNYLVWYNGSNRMLLSSAGTLTITGGISATTGSFSGAVTGSSTFTGTNFILQESDKRLKTGIQPIKDLSKFNDIKIIQYRLKSDPDQLRYGVIAQQVEKIEPELIRMRDDGYMSIAPIDLLMAKVAALEQRVTELERANERQVKRDWWFYNKCKKRENK